MALDAHLFGLVQLLEAILALVVIFQTPPREPAVLDLDSNDGKVSAGG